jgi:hypothetical protein
VWFNATSPAQATSVSAYLMGNWGTFGSETPEWGGDIGTFPGSMEVHAHMAAGQADRAHALMRLQWGYMLGKKQGTESTFWEGYRKDGSFAYQGIYMSNAHGWATGPAAALSFHTLGIRPAPPAPPATAAAAAGAFAYTVAPRFGTLEHCRGRLAFAAQAFVEAAWTVSAGAVTLAVNSSAMPAASSGAVSIDLSQLASGGSRAGPEGGARKPAANVSVNGVLVWRRDEGVLCAAGQLCGLHGVGAISVDTDGAGARGGAAVVELRDVQPQQTTLTVVVAF